MRLLDLFCGAGGAAMGYHRAGFDEIVGVDINPQPRYPFDFIQADALMPPVDLTTFDLIHASPPCQAYTALRTSWNAREHTGCLEETRTLLINSRRPYVIENVPGAPLGHSIRLCGTQFGLGIDGAELRRHRYFEPSKPISTLIAPCQHKAGVIGVSQAIPPAYTEWIGRQFLLQVSA